MKDFFDPDLDVFKERFDGGKLADPTLVSRQKHRDRELKYYHQRKHKKKEAPNGDNSD